MGYLHINNLYKEQDILLFKECYALEKVHGTSAHILFRDGVLYFHSGGSPALAFVDLFDQEKLLEKLTASGHEEVTIYGEAYGGKLQGMSYIYGKELKFIAFDIKVSDKWLDVINMDAFATSLGLEVVPWRKISTDVETLDAERDRESEVAIRRGMGPGKQREGVVLRPLLELRKNNDERIITKHRIQEFSERATEQKVIDPAKLEILQQAEAIANEWVVPMRLEHVLDKIPGAGMQDIPKVIAAMLDDVLREAVGEIIDSKEAREAIKKKTVELFKKRVQDDFRKR